MGLQTKKKAEHSGYTITFCLFVSYCFVFAPHQCKSFHEGPFYDS